MCCGVYSLHVTEAQRTCGLINQYLCSWQTMRRLTELCGRDEEKLSVFRDAAALLKVRGVMKQAVAAGRHT